MSKIKLYRHPLSGHSHRVELFISLLGLKAEMIDVNLLEGEHKQAEFLAKNAFAQVPVLEDGHDTLADSNAILVFLAKKYDTSHRWLPSSPVAAAEVARFLSLAAGVLAVGPAAARLVNVFGATLDHNKAQQIANDLLSILNDHLSQRVWLVGEAVSIADIANYTYIAHAPEGGVSLTPYPHLQRWLSRVEGLDNFVAMQKTAVGLAA